MGQRTETKKFNVAGQQISVTLFFEGNELEDWVLNSDIELDSSELTELTELINDYTN